MESSNKLMTRGALLLAVVVMASLAQAETPKAQANAQAALTRAQGLLRQLNEQKQQLELDNAKLKATSAGLEQQLKRAKIEANDQQAAAATRSKEIEQSSINLVHSKERNEKLTARLKDVIAKYKDTARTLRDSDAEKTSLQQQLSATRAELADAEQKNLALYQTNRQLIAKYQQKSRWTALLQKEPFVGFKQVEIENQAQAFEHDNAEQLRNTSQDADGMSD